MTDARSQAGAAETVDRRTDGDRDPFDLGGRGVRRTLPTGRVALDRRV